VRGPELLCPVALGCCSFLWLFLMHCVYFTIFLTRGVYHIPASMIVPSVTNNHSHRKVNLRGVFLGSKYACTQFLKQDVSPSGHRGWIINTASGAGLKGVGGGASKSSLDTNFSTPLLIYSLQKPPTAPPKAPS